MNAASQWRFEIAQALGQLYAQYPHVAAVIVGGSTARGHADQYSDVEMGIFWQHPPSDREREQVVQQASADLIRLYAYDPGECVWCDDFMIGRDQTEQPRTGLLVEVAHYETAFVERTLQAVLHTFSTDETAHNLLAGLLDAIPLHGTELITGWQTQARSYPRELALALVQKYGVIDHFWRWQMYLERGENLMLLYQSFSQVQQRVLYLLLALNRVYYGGFKWLEKLETQLVIKPPDLFPRLRQVYQMPPGEGAPQLMTLVEETFDLIETHLPEVDIERLRAIFRYQRPIWDHAPTRKP